MVLQRTLAQHTLLVFTGKKALEAISHTASTVRRVASAYKDCLASPLVSSYRSALSQSPTTVHSSDCGDCQESTRCTLSSWSDSSRPLPVCQYVASNRSCDSLGWAGYTYDEAVGLLIKEEARERSQQPPVEGWHGEDRESRVAGLGCDTNRTLGIFLVDNQKYSSLLYSLGLESGWEGGVILTPTEESIIADQGGVTESALEDLVISWHSGTRVTRPGLRSTHHTGGFIRMGRETPSPAPGPVVPPLCDPAMGGSCLAELDTHSLKSLVLGASSPGAVVFYTSPFCTHCTVVSHVFHTVQRILRPLDHLGLRFHTVDATRNDLPVQFTALSYPTVLVFPEHRKAESRLFPVGKELNTTNLLTFIVSNLSPSTRLRLALSSCSLTCLTKLRLSASAAIARLGNIAMRRPGLARRRSYQRRLKYNKTVLYVVTAWSASKTAIPRVSESFVAAILESFKEVSKR